MAVSTLNTVADDVHVKGVVVHLGSPQVVDSNFQAALPVVRGKCGYSVGRDN